MKENNKSFLQYINYAGAGLAFLFIILHCFMTYKHGVKFINSDQSAELMLGKILAGNHSVLAKDWYYSTELRVFGMNLIYSMAWMITKNYTGVMVLSQAICLGIMYTSMAFYYKKMDSKLYLLYPVMLMVPFSCEYYLVIVFALHYILHVSVTFFTLGMLIVVLKAVEKEKTPGYVYVVFLTCAVLSFLEGLGGMRMLIVLYVPLLAAAMFATFIRQNNYQPGKWEKKSIWNLAFCGGNLIFAGAGYLVNAKVLQNRYHFQSWQDIVFDSAKPEILWKAAADYLRLFGFEGGRVFSFKGITCILAVMGLFAVIYLVIKALFQWKTWNLWQQMTLLFGLFANACILAIFVFSNIYYESRYYIPAICCLWPIVFMMLEKKEQNEVHYHKMQKPAICALFVLSAFCLTVTTYKAMIQKDATKNDRTVTEFLMEEGYEYGFATFWHANIMNQISDDHLTVCPIENLNKMNRYKWLTSEQILNTDYDGAVFLVIEDIEHEIYQYNEVLSNTDRIVYARDGMWVYSFGSYEEFAAYLSE